MQGEIIGAGIIGSKSSAHSTAIKNVTSIFQAKAVLSPYLTDYSYSSIALPTFSWNENLQGHNDFPSSSTFPLLEAHHCVCVCVLLEKLLPDVSW